MQTGILRAGIVAVAMLIACQTGIWAQSSITTRIDEAARLLAEQEPRFQLLDTVQRRRLMEFVVGNALFVLGHELGHGVIGTFELPVLGGEEKAADVFATLALLHVGTDYAHAVLIYAARGLMLTAERDAILGKQLKFYQEHGLDRQRAYHIVCLMFGSNPVKFSELADRVKLPLERRESCVQELLQVQDSWVRLLKPHFRGSSSGKQSFLERLLSMSLGTPRRDQIDVRYSDVPPHLTVIREAMLKVALLESFRDFASDNFVFSERITIEAKSCGEPNAFWDQAERRLVLCYELVADYTELAIRVGI